jgi:hypothetical protein
MVSQSFDIALTEDRYLGEESQCFNDSTCAEFEANVSFWLCLPY